MTRTLDLSTQTNWGLIYSVSIPATVISTNGNKTYYAKIAPIRPIAILNKPILGISVKTIIPTGKQWAYAGSILRFTNSALGDIFIEEIKHLLLNKFNLVISDNLTNSYQIEINVPQWFISCDLLVYQYIASDTVSSIQQDLKTIEQTLATHTLSI